MSSATAINGAATEAAFDAITKAFDTAGSFGTFGSSVASAAEKARDAGTTWLEQSKALTLLALDAFDSGVNAYVEFTRSLASAAKVADRAMGAAEDNAMLVSEMAAAYSSAARDLIK
jgi:hypothetical protein